MAVELPRNVNNTNAMINPGDYIMSVNFSFLGPLKSSDNTMASIKYIFSFL